VHVDLQIAGHLRIWFLHSALIQLRRQLRQILWFAIIFDKVCAFDEIMKAFEVTVDFVRRQDGLRRDTF